MVCIITLIFAAGIISPLNDIEEYADEHGGRLDVNPNNNNIRNRDGSSRQDFDAGSSRGAAGFLIFVCCAGIVFHSVSIAVRVYYIRVGTRKYMCMYYVVVSKSVYCCNIVHIEVSHKSLLSVCIRYGFLATTKPSKNQDSR